MIYSGERGHEKVSDIKIAYIGGGSRGWAWGLMSDILSFDDISGRVSLYDIDRAAAERNEIIGNKFNGAKGAKTHWDYSVADTLEESLCGADFVIISIMPGTFDEMESDVHAPEKYGIYQSVGDTVGLGGIIRALRTAPMFETIGKAIKKYCPKAWVINYTNPMTLCVKTLYRVFPEIKAFGCCHEVFGTQAFLTYTLKEIYGIDGVDRKEIKTEVVGINHFTWITKAQYRNIDLLAGYKKFVEKYAETGYRPEGDDKTENWLKFPGSTGHRVKMDLFRRYGYIAAAGDRHLAEFCPGNWYLKDPETVKKWQFTLTPVSYRKEDLKARYKRSDDLISGKEEVALANTGEEGVMQIRAILGLSDLVTNVNMPNRGQILNLPLGAVVETNAAFSLGKVNPVCTDGIPKEIYSLVSRVVAEQEALDKAIADRDLDEAFAVFIADPQMRTGLENARELFDTMINNTKKYLSEYFKGE
ncbi:MAG TPA: alpha-glucosidase/alpha-galactosidase [Clostridiales bacterium]|nr:alpha-glucosidase/alpha-galactosidase [Clostridiales bacterium]